MCSIVGCTVVVLYKLRQIVCEIFEFAFKFHTDTQKIVKLRSQAPQIDAQTAETMPTTTTNITNYYNNNNYSNAITELICRVCLSVCLSILIAIWNLKLIVITRLAKR